MKLSQPDKKQEGCPAAKATSLSAALQCSPAHSVTHMVTRLLVLQQLPVGQPPGDAKLVEERKYRPRHRASTISVSG